MEKRALYEQLKQASDELETQGACGDGRHRAAERAAPPPGVRARAGVDAEVAVSREHVARVPDAAQRDPRLHVDAAAGRRRRARSRRSSGIWHAWRRTGSTCCRSSTRFSTSPASRRDACRCRSRKFKVPDLVGEVLAELEPIVRRSKLDGHVRRSPSDLKPITSDRQKVKQILLNLSEQRHQVHAVRAACPDRRSDAAGAAKSFCVSVRTPASASRRTITPRIFEDFKQLDNSPTRAYGGTGLGLSICRRLAEIIGGDISVQSQLGEGSTFTLTLPLSRR